eukprot:COSAG02_NODE_4651_length_5132_cov_7.294854_2_plen_66_part_00
MRKLFEITTGMEFYRIPHLNSYLFHCKIAESAGRSYEHSAECRAGVVLRIHSTGDRNQWNLLSGA